MLHSKIIVIAILLMPIFENKLWNLPLIHSAHAAGFRYSFCPSSTLGRCAKVNKSNSRQASHAFTFIFWVKYCIFAICRERESKKNLWSLFALPLLLLFIGTRYLFNNKCMFTYRGIVCYLLLPKRDEMSHFFHA